MFEHNRDHFGKELETADPLPASQKRLAASVLLPEGQVGGNPEKLARVRPQLPRSGGAHAH